LSEVEDVDVGAKADVVGQIVAFVVGIVVDDDLVAAPVPPGAVAYVKGSNTPEEAVEAEAVGSAAVEMPDVAATDAAGEMAVLPGVIEMVVGVVFTGVVTDPLAVVMNVGRFGMARFIAGLKPPPTLSPRAPPPCSSCCAHKKVAVAKVKPATANNLKRKLLLNLDMLFNKFASPKAKTPL
jgi:hypothetical protein